jgi:hypothetical protein
VKEVVYGVRAISPLIVSLVLLIVVVLRQPLPETTFLVIDEAGEQQQSSSGGGRGKDVSGGKGSADGGDAEEAAAVAVAADTGDVEKAQVRRRRGREVLKMAVCPVCGAGDWSLRLACSTIRLLPIP